MLLKNIFPQRHFYASHTCNILLCSYRTAKKMNWKTTKVLWYFRVSRLLGVFPVHISTGGTLKYTPWSALTLLPVVFSLTYSVATSDFMYSTVKAQLRHLSYVLTILPTTITTILADCFIRMSSIYYCNDLVTFIALTAYGPNQHAKGFMNYFWVVPALFSLCFVFRDITQAIGMSESDIPVTAVGTATGMHHLVPFLLLACDLLHDGALCSALWFLMIFGERALSSFALLCEEVLEFGRIQSDRSAYTALQIARKVGAVDLISCTNHAQKLAEKFVRLKIAFVIYSKIGGLFVFALIADMAPWLYYLVCTVLFNHEIGSTPFIFPIMAIQSLTHTLVLVTIAELGHQMDCEVTRQTVPICVRSYTHHLVN